MHYKSNSLLSNLTFIHFCKQRKLCDTVLQQKQLKGSTYGQRYQKFSFRYYMIQLWCNLTTNWFLTMSRSLEEKRYSCINKRENVLCRGWRKYKERKQHQHLCTYDKHSNLPYCSWRAIKAFKKPKFREQRRIKLQPVSSSVDYIGNIWLWIKERNCISKIYNLFFN